MIRFTAYWGEDVYIVPQRVLFVRDGGCGSRGLAAEVHLDTGKIVTLNDRADRVQQAIADALCG